MSSDKEVVITASADAAIVQHSLNIFENPVKDRIELEIVSDVDHYVTCEVIDLMGRTVASKIGRTNTSQSIDMSHASDGYIVRATSGLVNFRARILKGFSIH